MEKLDGLFRSKESAEAAAEPIHEGVPAGE